MPDPETTIRACNRMRAELPVLQALAAHSPYWHGIDSGFATARAQLFRGYPRADIPRAFADWADYEATMSAVVAAAGVADYTFLWWDIRPHPKLGTLEVRAMDAQARLGSVCGLAALVHGLVIAAAEAGEDAEELPREVLVESSFRAGRDGLDATVWHDGALRPIRELAAAAVERARPDARAVGAEAALEEVERILRDGNGAQRMRAAHAEGGMARVARAARRRVGRAAGGHDDVVRPAQRPAPARRRATTAAPRARSRSPSRRCSTCAPPRTPCWSAATSASAATRPSTRWPASCSRRCRCPCTCWPATTTTPRR